MDRVDCVVIGAGVIGLAVARKLAQAGREVIVLEEAEAIGTVTSSRNSEVIHAGIYYRAGSWMARMCVAGKHALYRYCDERGIPHKNCGKLIVATSPKETEKLQSIKAHAEANCVLDMQLLSGEAARALEPALACDAALLSPSTGIIDSHAYMLSLRGEAEDAGAAFAFHTPLIRAKAAAGFIEIDAGGEAPMTLQCSLLVNAAGLSATHVARSIDGMPLDRIPAAYLAKGNYFSCNAKAPFSRLIYPVPEPGGLGVHLTLDMAGQARFGPDVEWIETIDYEVDPSRAERFYPAIRKYWPTLPDGALMPSYSGIRPKIVPPAVATQDFLMQGPRDHGVAGLINLFGIESPGLTSSLAIADHVAELADIESASRSG
ncbi:MULTISPECIES: NAD(P)/FAD-dependent oxidoreductase [Bradyrhizobium]|uniref:NAD(P)/FAD-dependent oxidoreductase n=1 Tax=Bradyrhizobium TaxID=374 RepID=UPI00155E1E2C|nr:MULTISPECIES: NAD(P)/FAD-dependent oxidoreductase [Bradyrhizobium]MDD1517243.1 FAD-dependent oxidoreductase [Bradyrhizobium sp. WBAH30]MDD1541552.1 FAD-dependent oxidoreductase [Bradyrhizobium sp. WBAH41]MDD1555582.1 FAD-dependent oxidoreductase [Bradyrhizobium sp. WBAH23]MDD1564413.1 FAD-dependent oxidoreductase [Bradyrhizobium sp. WBAH33]MDD1593591.1 FAD-dependent oxidoreductase [Bradyrhizobium sp. WBAH42]